jgi:tetratricopeptide (TPR) repeat protein
MNVQAPACKELLSELNAFVDGELEPVEVARIAGHTERCGGCSGYLDTLRKLSQLHRRSAELLDGMEAPADAQLELDAADDAPDLDTAGLVGRLLVRATEGEWTTLSRLFYELGKAYVLLGNKRLSRAEVRRVNVRRAPADIRRTEERARRRLTQIDRLQAAGSAEPRDVLLRDRSRRLMDQSSRAGSGAVLKGRRFLEECLALQPDHDEARLYLGFALLVSGRVDRARAEFRRVNRDSSDPALSLMAMQWLGNLAVNIGRFDEAIDCYEAVVTSDAAPGESRLFSSFLNMPVTLAKLGRWEEAAGHFSVLAQRFPERIDQVREMLAGMTAFRRLLDQNIPLQRTLHDKVPGLFAAA